jgi:predicted O-methyltransferase YrrM
MEHVIENDCWFTTFRGVRGTLSPACVEALINETKNLGPEGRYLETGSYLGCSSLIVAAHSNATVWSHDIWVTDWSELKGGPPPEVKDYFYEFYNMVKDNNLIHRIIPIRGNSVYTVGIHDDESVDVAFVDGDHSFEGCLADLQAVLPKMKKKSTVLVHDCYHGGDCQRAVREFVGLHGFEDVYLVPNSCGMFIIRL